MPTLDAFYEQLHFRMQDSSTLAEVFSMAGHPLPKRSAVRNVSWHQNALTLAKVDKQTKKNNTGRRPLANVTNTQVQSQSSQMPAQNHKAETACVTFNGKIGELYDVSGSAFSAVAEKIQLTVTLTPACTAEQTLEMLYGGLYKRALACVAIEATEFLLVAGAATVDYHKLSLQLPADGLAIVYALTVLPRADKLRIDEHVLYYAHPLAEKPPPPPVYQSAEPFELKWNTFKLQNCRLHIGRSTYSLESEPADDEQADAGCFQSAPGKHHEVFAKLAGAVGSDALYWKLFGTVPKHGQLLHLVGSVKQTGSTFSLAQLDTLMATAVPDVWRKDVPQDLSNGWLEHPIDGAEYSYCRAISMATGSASSACLSLSKPSITLTLETGPATAPGAVKLTFANCWMTWFVGAPDDAGQTAVQAGFDATLVIGSHEFDAAVRIKPAMGCYATLDSVPFSCKDEAMSAIRSFFERERVACELQDCSDEYGLWYAARRASGEPEIPDPPCCIMLEIQPNRTVLVSWAVNDELVPMEHPL